MLPRGVGGIEKENPDDFSFHPPPDLYDDGAHLCVRTMTSGGNLSIKDSDGDIWITTWFN